MPSSSPPPLPAQNRVRQPSPLRPPQVGKFSKGGGWVACRDLGWPSITPPSLPSKNPLSSPSPSQPPPPPLPKSAPPSLALYLPPSFPIIFRTLTPLSPSHEVSPFPLTPMSPPPFLPPFNEPSFPPSAAQISLIGRIFSKWKRRMPR